MPLQRITVRGRDWYENTDTPGQLVYPTGEGGRCVANWIRAISDTTRMDTGLTADQTGAAGVNTSVMNTALAEGGTITLLTPGTYFINGTLEIPSDTHWRLGEGVFIKATNGLADGSPMLRTVRNTGGNVWTGTWDRLSFQITQTGAFTNYVHQAGDRIYVTHGPGVKSGWYTVNARNNANTITLDRDIGDATTDGAVVEATILPTRNITLEGGAFDMSDAIINQSPPLDFKSVHNLKILGTRIQQPLSTEIGAKGGSAGVFVDSCVDSLLSGINFYFIDGIVLVGQCQNVTVENTGGFVRDTPLWIRPGYDNDADGSMRRIAIRDTRVLSSSNQSVLRIGADAASVINDLTIDGLSAHYGGALSGMIAIEDTTTRYVGGTIRNVSFKNIDLVQTTPGSVGNAMVNITQTGLKNATFENVSVQTTDASNVLNLMKISGASVDMDVLDVRSAHIVDQFPGSIVIIDGGTVKSARVSDVTLDSPVNGGTVFTVNTGTVNKLHIDNVVQVGDAAGSFGSTVFIDDTAVVNDILLSNIHGTNYGNLMRCDNTTTLPRVIASNVFLDDVNRTFNGNGYMIVGTQYERNRNLTTVDIDNGSYSEGPQWRTFRVRFDQFSGAGTSSTVRVEDIIVDNPVQILPNNGVMLGWAIKTVTSFTGGGITLVRLQPRGGFSGISFGTPYDVFLAPSTDNRKFEPLEYRAEDSAQSASTEPIDIIMNVTDGTVNELTQGEAEISFLIAVPGGSA